MPFLFLGLILTAFAVYFLLKAQKKNDHDSIVGMTAIIIAGLILTIFFGLLYTGLLSSV